MSGTFACPICGRDTPHQHTDDEIQAAQLMAMPEAEVDAELRRLGIDPDEAARQGKAAVEGALEAIRARNAGVPTRRDALLAAAVEAEAVLTAMSPPRNARDIPEIVDLLAKLRTAIAGVEASGGGRQP